MTDRRYGLSLQTVTDPAELELARQLNARLDVVEPFLERWARIAQVRAGASSELAYDDKYSAWRQLSHTVNGAINLAADNLRAFRDLVRPGSELIVPQVAHYSLLRSALEGGSLALWILHPDDPSLRIDRLLRTAAAELEDEDALAKQAIDGYAADPDIGASGASIDKARKQNKKRHQKHAHQIQSVAREFGLHDPTERGWKVGYAEIVREATATTGVRPYFGETTWRMISGLTHPSLMRTTTRSNVEEIADNADGTFNALVTSDLGLTRMAFEAAWLNASHAVDLLGSRKLKPADPTRYPTRSSHSQ